METSIKIAMAMSLTLQAGPWASPMPFPEGSKKYETARYTQSISVLNNRDLILRVRIKDMENTDWHQSGGMYGITGWKSEKWRLVPGKVKTWVEGIQVRNDTPSVYQTNYGLVRKYPDGTRFDDILSTDAGVFEHRVREKKDGVWTSKIIYEDRSARPKGYKGLKVSCASCHNKTGTGGYSDGLVPGGDTVLSDPLDWSVAHKLMWRE